MSADNTDYQEPPVRDVPDDPNNNVQTEVRLPAYRECPTCGAYMMDAAKHRDWHEWLERQLAAASIGFPTGFMP